MPTGVGWSPPDPNDGAMTFVAALDLAGVIVGNFALRGRCYVDLPDRAMMLQLETGKAGVRPRIPLVRIEWRPLGTPHKNPQVGPQEHRSRIIAGSHLHPLNLNWLETEARMREHNLPIAVPLDNDPQSYPELLDTVKNLFRINGLGGLKEPEWALKLM